MLYLLYVIKLLIEYVHVQIYYVTYAYIHAFAHRTCISLTINIFKRKLNLMQIYEKYFQWHIFRIFLSSKHLNYCLFICLRIFIRFWMSHFVQKRLAGPLLCDISESKWKNRKGNVILLVIHSHTYLMLFFWLFHTYFFIYSYSFFFQTE